MNHCVLLTIRQRNYKIVELSHTINDVKKEEQVEKIQIL